MFETDVVQEAVFFNCLLAHGFLDTCAKVALAVRRVLIKCMMSLIYVPTLNFSTQNDFLSVGLGGW